MHFLIHLKLRIENPKNIPNAPPSDPINSDIVMTFTSSFKPIVPSIGFKKINRIS